MSDQIVNMDDLTQLTALDPEDFLLGIDVSQVDPDLASIIIKAKNSIFDIKVTHDLSSGDIEHALPTAVGFNRRIIIKFSGGVPLSKELSFTTVSGQTIDGDAATVHKGQGEGIFIFYSDNINWQLEVYEDEGSNSDGEWSKFRNGDLFMTERAASADSNQGSGSVFRSPATLTWTFPYTTAVSILYHGCTGQSNQAWGVFEGITTTLLTYRLMTQVSRTGIIPALFAKGKWK